MSIPVVKQYERGVHFRLGRIIITRDNVSVEIAAVAYFRVVDAKRSVAAINVVGQHCLDDVLADTAEINGSIRSILDKTTLEWGIEVTFLELKDIQLAV